MTDPGTPAVAVRDVFRIYQTRDGDAPALQGVSLTVAPGELVAIIGPSGSGKSTLLRLLAGHEHPDAGDATVLGRSLRALSGSARDRFRARELGVIDQSAEDTIAPDATCRDAVALQSRLLGATRVEARRRADELLDRVGLARHGERRVRELSGGQRQRVAAAAAIAHRPRLLLADEPTGELDARSAAEVYGVIARLVREEQATAVLVSHDPAIASVADRVLTIADGRFAAERAGATGTLVVNSSGWVQLPEHVRRTAGIGDRVAVEAGTRDVVLRGNGDPASVLPSTPPTRARSRSMPVAELRDVWVSYGDVPVLEGITHTFRSGTVTAVAGPSGSGKTTLLRVLAASIAPVAGHCNVAGVDPWTLDDDALADLRRRVLAVVEQDVGLVPFLTARENVAFACDLRGRAPDAVDPLLHRLGLAHRSAQRVARLSAGERQRVALARALAARPRLMLVDEPTSRLDRVNARAVAELLARVAAEDDVCVICASHDPEIIDLADDHIALG